MAEAVMERCISQMGKQRRSKEKSRKVPQGVRTSAKVLCPTHPHATLMAGPHGVPRASPGVAADLHCISWGILLALVEAGAPLQGHTLVFMPDLRVKNSRDSCLQGHRN